MPDSPSKHTDVAELLEQLACRIRTDPSFLAAEANAPGGLTVYASGDASNDVPLLGEVDVQSDASAITVTAETRNADANNVHVTLAEDKLSIGLGVGLRALRKDLVLPAAVDEERAVATLRNGILDIVLPLRAPKSS